MGIPNWLSTGVFSTFLSVAGISGATAQEVENEARQDTTEVTAQQEIDYSKVPIDRVQVSYNGTPLQDNLVKFLTRGTELNDAEDAYNLNIKLQRMLEGSDPTLQRIIRSHTRNTSSTPEGENNISVQAYNGETEYSFDAKDVPNEASDLKNEAKPQENEQPVRRDRGRSRGNNGQQLEP